LLLLNDFEDFFINRVKIMNWWLIVVELCLSSLHEYLFKFVCWWGLNWCGYLWIVNELVSDCCWIMFEIHFTNVCLSFYVEGVRISVVIYEVWMKIEKLWVFVKNEHNVDFGENWCYDLMFVVVLNVFWCI